MKFKTTLRQSGKTATGIEVPAEIVRALSSAKRFPVRVTINGYTYRNSVAPMGGVYMIGVSAEHRAGAGIEGGDEIEVTLEADAEPRELEIPADLTAALTADETARVFFAGLSRSAKQRYVLPIEGAKTFETRARRVARAIEDLRLGKK